MRNVLVTGATGYIGRRLAVRLLARKDLAVRLLVRNRHKVGVTMAGQAQIVEGDTFSHDALAAAVKGIDTAYYLIHSMGAGADFEQRDRQSAENFRAACVAAGVRRIVYLGGLGVKETASAHLKSRIETGEMLSLSPEKLQTVWFRAGVIIGSGSASFEIIRNLVQKLPVMVTPKWVNTKTQPISVEDALAYLEAAVDLNVEGNLVVDIGAEQMSFKEMMAGAARVMGLRRVLVPVPVLSPRLSSFWLILFTSVPFRMAAALVEGLKSETILQNDHAKRYFPAIQPRPYAEAVALAISEMEDNQVVSRWCDSSGGAVCDIKDQQDTAGAILRDSREFPLNGLSAQAVFEAICTLGGKQGWYTYSVFWQIRGWLDKCFGGYGLNRGRRDRLTLRVGDALDFWKVSDLRENKRVLLLAQMKLPGKAWLEFDILDDQLVQTAHFIPKGVWGRLYWYAVLPFHHLVFGDLGQSIVRHAGESARQSSKGGEHKRRTPGENQ